MTLPFQDTGENIWVQIKRYVKDQYPPWESLPLLTRLRIRIFGPLSIGKALEFCNERGSFIIHFQLISYKNALYFYRFALDKAKI